MNLTILSGPCESLRVIAGEKTVRQSVAVRAGALSRKTGPVGVIVFPVFESYGDQIAQWLSELGERKPTRAALRKVTLSLRRVLGELERVHDSMRHRNMASLLRHTLEALRASEWEGARYLLMTGSAVMHARAIRRGASLNGPGADGVVLQFPPVPERSVELRTAEATTGMVTG